MRGVVMGVLAIGALVGMGLESPASGGRVERARKGRAWFDHKACVECHPVQAEQWEGSPHQTSFVEPTFQTAFALEPRGYCRRCHAPHIDPQRPHTASLGARGIDCVSCHVEDGTILAGPARSEAATVPVPHPLRRTTEFTTAAACARCHEFPFPDNGLRDRPLAMQRTMTEHAASRFSEQSCADCHMPRDDRGRASHAFVASRDPVIVRSAVEVRAERTGSTTVRITLEPGEIGHAFPTGDLLRRLEVGAVAVLPAGEGPARRRFLARHFGNRVQRTGVRLRDELRDDRVPPDGHRVVELTVPDAAGYPVRWWVEYQRVAHQRSFDEADAAIDGRITVAGGLLGPAEYVTPPEMETRR